MTFRTENRSTARRRSENALLRCLSILAALFGLCVFAESSFSAKTNNEESFQTVQSVDTRLGQITVKKRIEPEMATSFEPFVLTVEIQKPKNATLAPDDLAGVYGDFNVEFLGDKERNLDEASNVVTRSWRLYPQKRGDLETPPIPIAVTEPPESETEDAQSVVVLIPRQKFSIPETDVPPKSIDAIEPTLEPIRQTSILTIVVVALVIIAAAFAFRKVVFPKNVVDSAVSERSAESPYDRAIRRLNELKNSRTYLENTPQFYTDVDSILREYVAGVFPINAQEKTTQEILRFVDAHALSAISDSNMLDCQTSVDELATEPSETEKADIAVSVLREPEIRARMESALTTLDLVKFAKRSTSFVDASQIYNDVRDVVELSFKRYAARIDERRKELAERIVTEVVAQNATASLPSSKEEHDALNVR